MTVTDRAIEERIEATRACLEAACLSAGHWISGDGRVGEETVADLLGMTCGTLGNKRTDGTGPRWFRLGGNGHRVTYRLADVAVWIEAQRCE